MSTTSFFHIIERSPSSKMHGPRNLFKSNAGTELASEICLLIAEQVLEQDPNDARTLLLLSKVKSNFIVPLLLGTTTTTDAYIDFLLPATKIRKVIVLPGFVQ